MGVVSLLWRHLATTHRPPPVRTPFVVPKTQSQVQRNTAHFQEEAEPPRRWHLRPSPAQESRRDAPLHFAYVLPMFRWCLSDISALHRQYIQNVSRVFETAKTCLRTDLAPTAAN
jgi:hypothetical protein